MSEIENQPVVATPATDTSPVAAAPSPAPETSTPSEAAPPAATAASETPPAEIAPEVKVEPSLLGSEPAVETKVEEVKTEVKIEEQKPVEAHVDADHPALPVYEAFKVPEGFKKDDKAMGDFQKILGEFQNSKPADQKSFQEFGQKALDFHIERLGEQTKHLTDYFVSIGNKMKSDDADALRKDPVIGGNGDDKVFESNMRGLVNFLASHGGSKEEVTEFRKYVQDRGVDASLPIARVLNNLKSRIERYENEASKMLPGTKPQADKPAHPGKGMMKSLYGGNKA